MRSEKNFALMDKVGLTGPFTGWTFEDLTMMEKLGFIENRYEKLAQELGRSEVLANQQEFQKLAREFAELGKIVNKFRQLKKIIRRIAEAKEILKEEKEDRELRDLAELELSELQVQNEALEREIKLLLLPKDPNDERDIFLEIRAGTGGEEAALFVADLFRLYAKYCEKNNWKIEIVNSNPTGVGGFKEVISSVQGEGVYSKLKYESGTHRVQRVPATEASGRIHTSAVTVAILPEAEEVEVDIDPNDLRIDVFRSSGPGGQSVNTTDSAVRITHIPTGIVVSCQDEKSQHKNKAKGMRVLRARLLDKLNTEQREKISQERRIQVGSGDRSERIRTYNFPQGRVTDHRLNLTLYKLQEVMQGQLDDLIDALSLADQMEAINDLEVIGSK